MPSLFISQQTMHRRSSNKSRVSNETQHSLVKIISYSTFNVPSVQCGLHKESRPSVRPSVTTRATFSTYEKAC